MKKWFFQRCGLAVLVLGTITATGCLLSYDIDSEELQEGDDGVPRLIMTSPEVNQGFDCVLEVRLDIKNFVLSDAIGMANVEGEGHLHIYVAGMPIPPDDSGVIDANIDIPVDGIIIDGSQDLRVVAHNNDHTEHATIQDIWRTWEKLPVTAASACFTGGGEVEGGSEGEGGGE